MATIVTIYPKTVVWNALTWNSTGGGPLRVDVEIGGDPVAEQSGDSDWNTFLQVANKRCRVVVRIRDVTVMVNPGTGTTTLACTFSSKQGNHVLTFGANMILVSGRISQDRAVPGDIELVFMHESSDGTTFPLVYS